LTCLLPLFREAGFDMNALMRERQQGRVSGE
jgi:hypothetical protein